MADTSRPELSTDCLCNEFEVAAANGALAQTRDVNKALEINTELFFIVFFSYVEGTVNKAGDLSPHPL